MTIFRVSSNIDISTLAYGVLIQQIQRQTGEISFREQKFFPWEDDAGIAPNCSLEITKRSNSLFHGVEHLIDTLAMLAPGKDLSYLAAWLKKEKKTFEDKINSDFINTPNQIKAAREELAEILLYVAIELLEQVESIEPEFFSVTDTIDQKISRMVQLIDRAEEFYIAKTPRETRVTVVQIDNLLHAQIDKPVNAFNSDSLRACLYGICSDEEALQPEWFKKHPRIYQVLIRDWAQVIIKDPDAIYSLSSRSDLVPGVRNFLEHISILIDPDNLEEPQVSSALRSSHIAGRPNKLEATTSEASLFFAKLNWDAVTSAAKNYLVLEKSCQNGTILFQTLLSPTPGSADTKLCAYKDQVLNGYNDASLKIIPTNHGVNLGRILTAPFESNDHIPELAKETSEDSLFLQAAKIELLTLYNNSRWKMVQTLIDNTTGQLHLAAVEELVARHEAAVVSYGGCISGKDRKGLELLYATTLEIYHYKYKKFFNLNEASEEDLINFYAIFAVLFLSNHAQLTASDNAPGAAGLKELNNNASKHLKNRVGENRFAIEHNLGNLNTLAGMIKKSSECENILATCNYDHQGFRKIKVRIKSRITPLHATIAARKELFNFLQDHQALSKQLKGKQNFCIANKAGEHLVNFNVSQEFHDILTTIIACLDNALLGDQDAVQTHLQQLSISLLAIPETFLLAEKILFCGIRAIFDKHFDKQWIPKMPDGEIEIMRKTLNAFLCSNKKQLQCLGGYVYSFNDNNYQLTEIKVSSGLYTLLSAFNEGMKKCLWADPDTKNTIFEELHSRISTYKGKKFSFSGMFKPQDTEQAVIDLLRDALPKKVIPAVIPPGGNQ